MDIVKVLGIIAVAMTVVGGAAFIYAYYLVSLNRAQLEGLRGDRDDLIKRVDLLEKDKLERVKTAVEKDAEIVALNAKITVLEGIVTHDVSINKLIAAVEEHDKNVENRYGAYMRVTNETLQYVKKLIEIQEVRNASIE